VEPVSTILTGLALARQAISFVKENMDSLDDAAEIAGRVGQILEGHHQYNKQRYKPSLRDSLQDAVEWKLQQEELYNLSVALDMRLGNGFYASVVQQHQEKLKQIAEQERIARAQRRKKVEQALIGGSLIAALGIAGFLIFMIIMALRN